MVSFSTSLETVNGMSRCRRLGCGRVKTYLKSVGVPRANAYRWEGQLRQWYEEGPAEVAALCRERETQRMAIYMVTSNEWFRHAGRPSRPLSRGGGGGQDGQDGRDGRNGRGKGQTAGRGGPACWSR